ncbi:hypothetical protein ACMGT0_01170 [Pseudomonas sp. RHF3.3-3]|uniref:hypothetical protein n=1 Tax=Pseudomonas sp. RHF3.3-3 TaxID=3396624 RepID=UPI003A8B3787
MPFIPPSLNGLPAFITGRFQNDRSEPDSRARQKLLGTTNLPTKPETISRIDAPQTTNESISNDTQIKLAIDELRAAQQDAEQRKGELLGLKEKFKSANNPLDKGILRYSEKKGLYLSANFSFREALNLKDAGSEKFERNFKGLGLDFGKVNDKQAVFTIIDDKVKARDEYINFLESKILDHEKNLSTKQPSMNGGDSDSIQKSHEPLSELISERLKSDQHGPSMDVVEPHPTSSPEIPALSPRTIRENGSPILKARVDHDHLAAMRMRKNSSSEIFEKILKLQCEQLEAENIERDLSFLKKQLDTNSSEQKTGYLHFSDVKGLYLSEDKTPHEKGGASKLKSKIPGLELGIGKTVEKTKVHAKIDELLEKQNDHIVSLGDSIARHRTELAFWKSKEKLEANGSKNNPTL